MVGEQARQLRPRRHQIRGLAVTQPRLVVQQEQRRAGAAGGEAGDGARPGILGARAAEAGRKGSRPIGWRAAA